MKIKGIQELTLLDYPGKLACTIFLFGCNLRCNFCHNPDLVMKEKDDTIPREEILAFLKKRKNILDGVCITGGEPLMTIKPEFLQEIKALNYKIKIDTNGCYPTILQELLLQNLINYVAMDIKSSKEKYLDLTNTEGNIKKIEQSIKTIAQLPDHEFRTTIIEGIHTIEEMKRIAQWLNQLIEKKPKKFILQGFKPQDNLIHPKFRKMKKTSEKYLQDLKEDLKDYFEEIEIRF